MSAVAHPSALGGPRNGGVAARRAVTRWARRMFRREWRQQLLVVTLLTVAVAAAIGSITLVYNTSSAVNSEFGSANTVLEFDGTNPRKLAAGLATAKKWFGTTDVIGHRSIAVPGSVDKVDFRAQDPDGAYGSDLLALRQGRYPEGRHEVAVTDGVAKLLRLDLGSTVGARRCSADSRRHRRESTQAQRRVRTRLARVRGRSDQRHGSGRRERRVARILPGLPGRESFRLRGNDEGRQRRAAGHARDVLGRHRLPSPGLAHRRRRLRCHRAATAPSPGHARRDRRDAEAPPPRAHHQRRHRRGDRRTLRDAHRPRALGRSSPRRSSLLSTIASTGSAFRGC